MLAVPKFLQDPLHNRFLAKAGDQFVVAFPLLLLDDEHPVFDLWS